MYIRSDLTLKAIYWIGCLPQNLLGTLLFFLLWLCCKNKVVHHTISGVVITECDWIYGGISLGMYVFVASRGFSGQQKARLIRHELGHTRQSLLLGPAYLLVIGMPSLIWALFRSAGFFKHKPYSWMYTERWADRLAEHIDITDV